MKLIKTNSFTVHHVVCCCYHSNHNDWFSNLLLLFFEDVPCWLIFTSVLINILNRADFGHSWTKPFVNSGICQLPVTTSVKKKGRKLVRAISAESIYCCMLINLDHILYRRAYFVCDALCAPWAVLAINTIYHFVKPFLDKKCLFLRNMEPLRRSFLL